MITSTANPQIKNLIQLQKKNRLRQEQGIFIIEGIKMYREAPTDQVIKTYVSESFYKNIRKKISGKGKAWKSSQTASLRRLLIPRRHRAC